jgi:hypothetical protein
MNRADHFRTSEDQVFVTAEEILTTEIFCSEVKILECGARGSIQDQNPLTKVSEELISDLFLTDL